MSAGTPLIERDRRGRRILERDRHGTEIATLSWNGDRLAEARVRLPDGSWLRVEPGAGRDPRWGASDVVHDARGPLTHFAAVAWPAIDAIPPLAEPARLPAGGGTAILNLIAGLAADQASGPLAYRGPYPTEQLFLALIESFRYESAPAVPPTAPQVPVAREGAHDSTGTFGDPLAAFVGGELVWRPAPHQRSLDPRGVYVQARERVEKVVWDGRAYYRAQWQGIERRAAHRVRDADDRVVCSLWALEQTLEDHVVLTPDGVVLEVRKPVAGGEPTQPMAPAVAAGLVAIVIAGSAAPLAASIRAEVAGVAFEWAPLAGELAAMTGGRARLSVRLLRALARRLGQSDRRADQVRLGFGALAEAAHALGDALRHAAQARLAAAPPAVQAQAFTQGAPSQRDAAAAARVIGEAVEQLLEEAGQLLA